ncbi:MAG TPA: hypothetical protein VKY36_06555 [Moheibacter sp.]|nr:hypothetical protein [Moheibacter sp.]
MSIKQRIYPPQNWNDFEELCLKLWGILWQIPNAIDFNSTNSQGQNGVDIYGIPNGESRYFGIQCKNFKPFTKSGKFNKLTLQNIKNEIKKAESFTPELKHFIIATTLDKDKEIEAAVREINLERIENNKFSVQICFWDYISAKLHDIPNLLNWYQNNQNFVGRKKVSVSFNKKTPQILNHYPTYNKVFKHYRLETQADVENERLRVEGIKNSYELSYKGSCFNLVERFFNFFNRNKKTSKWLLGSTILINGVDVNSEEYRQSQYPKRVIPNGLQFSLNSFVDDLCTLYFRIIIENEGTSVIEDYKLRLLFEGEFDKVDTVHPRISEVLSKSYKYDTFFNGKSCLIQPEKNFIIQNDYFISEKIQIIPKMGIKSQIKIGWEFICRDYHDKGELFINVLPKYESLREDYLVLNENECKIEEVIKYKTYEYLPQLNY